MLHERTTAFRFYYFHLSFLFVLQFIVLSLGARFSPLFLRLNLLIPLAVLVVWMKENSWWETIAFLGLGIAMDSFAFVPFGHFFFLSGITILFVFLWKELFSKTPVSLFFLFVTFPFVELLIEEAVTVMARGICVPLGGLILIKVLSIPVNMFFFLLWSWGEWRQDVE
ncbi:MAG: hypothetical protein ACP5Q4_01195 [Candidatus Caldatribacteriaceae bacterium]